MNGVLAQEFKIAEGHVEVTTVNIFGSLGYYYLYCMHPVVYHYVVLLYGPLSNITTSPPPPCTSHDPSNISTMTLNIS
jgi:hypothetical protein